MALTDFQSLVDNMVRDDSGEITVADRDEAIVLAAVRYSTDAPQNTVEQVAADGTSLLALPAGWEDKSSNLVKVEISSGDDITPLTGSLELTLSGEKIRLVESVAATQLVDVYFTIAHVLDGAQDTIPEKDRHAVSAWAAAMVLEQLSTLYSGNRQPTINADSVDWQNKGRDFASRAKTLRKFYQDHLGIDPTRSAPAGVEVDLDRPDSRGNARLFHKQTRR